MNKKMTRIIALILVGVMLTWLWQIILSHTGVDYGSRDAALLSSAATERLHRGFQIRLAVTFVLFFVAMIGNILDAILLLEYSWIWLISFAVSFAGICSASSLLHELKVQIQFRYQSDGMNKKL